MRNPVGVPCVGLGMESEDKSDIIVLKEDGVECESVTKKELIVEGK